ncbi:BRO-N domain-containing protein [Oryzomicrobium terrae]|nr:Bro-N domain-containing protein [Oryzomicrobium terrae]
MNVITFAFPSADHSAESQSPVRAFSRDGEPWLIAKDVAQILGYRDAEKMVRNLDDDEKDTQIVGTLGGDQVVLIINESGLYSAILRSRRKEAKRFKKWVTSTVLPSIRQHGGYLAGQESLSPTLVAALHKTIRENALPALRYYDRQTEHDHWKSPARSQASSEWAIQEAALKFDLPVSLMEKLVDQGVSALCA